MATYSRTATKIRLNPINSLTIEYIKKHVGNVACIKHMSKNSLTGQIKYKDCILNRKLRIWQTFQNVLTQPKFNFQKLSVMGRIEITLGIVVDSNGKPLISWDSISQ